MDIVRILPASELESLRELGRDAMSETILVDHGEKLLQCGLAKFQAGAFMITLMGRAKLAIEVTRASWLPAVQVAGA